MDFDVGEWQATQETEKLNEALFGSGEILKQTKKKRKESTHSVGSVEGVKAGKSKKLKEKVAKKLKEKSKPKTKDEALALAKTRKHHKRKLKQKLAMFHSKIGEAYQNLQIMKHDEKDDNRDTDKKFQKPPKNKYKHLAMKKDNEKRLQEKEELSGKSGHESDNNSPTACTGSKNERNGDSQTDIGKSGDLSKTHKKQKKKSLDVKGVMEVDDMRVEVVEIKNCPKKDKSRKRKISENSESLRLSDTSPQSVPSSKKQKKHKQPCALSAEQEPLTDMTSGKKHKFDICKLQQILGKTTKSKDQDKANVSDDNAPEVSTASMSLKERMQDKLNSARFRYINQQLYTSHSEEALAMMKQDPEAFHVYHQGFQHQVNKWPVNPLHKMISYLNEKPKDLVVADLGCGDASLAASVKQKVYSFDLVATKDRVIACDIANVPLENGSVDVSVFCLSLMGTNLVDFLVEAYRITKKRGILLVAEVISRFEKVGAFIRKMGKLGFKLLSKDESNKMFIWMEFEKTAVSNKGRLPKIELAPCSYKRR